MAESETSAVKSALASLHGTAQRDGGALIPDMSDETRRQVIDPFDAKPHGYWMKLAQQERERRIRSWESTVYY